MTLKTKATSILGYRVFPTSILALVVYVSLFVALIVTDALSNPPSPTKRGVLDLRQAYEDLRHITAHPHPYNSHANDRVRSYILERLQFMKQGYTFVHVDNDTRSNGSWASEKYGVYFEGSNILVKIDGTSSSSTGGVLFSAHFDSVSTAPGATDDGMGVATLLQLVNHFSINRMPRTAVFNINNGEEDWLNGAHAFLEHPWSNLTDAFLNLEGAAAGGRPILFRATSTSSVKAFRNRKLVPHPHGNVLSSDGFARGLIRSGTDFSVYATPGPRNGMDGLDLAFYKGRSKYHTKYDAVPFVMGGENSLWSMMETARGVGENLLSAPFAEIDEGADTNDVPVYFDLFKSVILVFPISGMLTFNVVTLIIGPIALIFLALCDFLLGSAHKRKGPGAIQAERVHVPPPLRNRSSQPEPRQGASHRHVHPIPPLPDALQGEELLEGHHFSGPVASCLGVFWRNIKFWVALVVVLVLDALLAWGYVLFNPFAIYSLPYTVLFAFLSLSYLVLTFVLTLPSSLPFYHSKYWFQPSPAAIQPAQQQKYSIFISLYIFTWILLVFSTLGITKLHPGVGGGYLFSAWNICVAAACILVAVEGIILTSLGYESPKVIDEDGRQPEDLLESNRLGPDHRHSALADSDERTPLLSRDNAAAYDTSLLPSSKDLSGGEDGGAGTLATWWWIPQFLVSVPIPVTLFAHVTMMVLDGMAQTLADGPSPWTVYIFTALLAVVLILPLAPFSYKLRPFRPLTFLVILVFALSTAYTWLVFPFTPQDPLKIYFQQVVVLPTLTTSNLASNSLPRLTTVLLGPERYLRSSLMPSLPSSHKHGKVVNCSSDSLKLGLTRCEWESGPHMRPNPGSAENTDFLWKKGEFLTADISKTGRSTARIRVKGKNTRSCRLYFDSRPIFRYDVLMPDTNRFLVKGMQKGYEVSPSGVKEVRLWSRTWENEFVVDVDWSNSTGAISPAEENDLEGRIACEWNEYESGMVDNGPFNKPPGQRLVATDGTKPKIPALEEVLNFLPDWAVVSKAADGLVEAWAPFTL